MKLLDLFCGAGGAAEGYRLAGFDDITGVDMAPQPRYPFKFIQAEALAYLTDHYQEYDVIHASPPCQGYSIMYNLPWLRLRTYPLLILPLKTLLNNIGKPYIIENVMGARYGARGLAKRGLEEHGLKADYLCGTMFGLAIYRHRLFATNWIWTPPAHPKHTLPGHPRSGGSIKGLPGGAAGLDIRKGLSFNPPLGMGHTAGWRQAAQDMGIDWMNQYELTQAIPPSYTKFIGTQFLGV